MSDPTSIVIPGAFLRLWEKTRDEVFVPSEVEELLGSQPYVELTRLVQRGWLFRLGRGRYATVDPIVRVTPGVEPALRPFRSECWYPILHRMVGGVLRVYTGRVVGIVLFGSMARGTGGPTSDIDLAVFADHLPDDAWADSEDAMSAERSAEPLASAELAIRQHYHAPSVIAGPADSFDSPGRIMLGIVGSGKILFDPQGKVSEGFETLRRAFRKAGVKEYRTDDGRPYWFTGTLFDQEVPA